MNRLVALVAVLFSAAVTLTACEVEKAVTDFATRLINTKPEDRAKALAATPENQRAAVIRQVYGANTIYLSPQAQAQLFASEENFIFGVLAPGWDTGTDFSFKDVLITSSDDLRKKSEVYERAAANIADLVKLGPSLPAIAAANLATLKLASGGFVNPRAEAIKQRLGRNSDLFAQMDERQLRDLIWDDAKFEKFMADDAYAINYVARAAAGTDHLRQGNQDASSYISTLTRDGLGPAGGSSARTGT